MTRLTTTNVKNDEPYPSHDLAKIVNNRAAYQIARFGNYQEGINLLTKALKLSERSTGTLLQSEVDRFPCSCKFCSLESCLELQEDAQPHYHQSRSNTTITRNNKSESVDSSSTEDLMGCDDSHDDNPYSTSSFPQTESYNPFKTSRSGNEQQAEDTHDDEDDGFVFHRLLLNDRSIDEKHYMGSTLPLIILFNLALTHHLVGIDNRNNDNFSLAERFKSLEDALKLYELAYQLHIGIIEQQKLQANKMMDGTDDVVSLRLTMIVSNNLGQIHRVVGNSKKYKMCLQHLLSTIMYIGQQRQLFHNSSSSINNNHTVLNSTEFDRFLRNISPILITDICASAA